MDGLLSNEDLFAASGRYGYLHPGYAESYVAAGEVRHLRRSGSWMLTRSIPGVDQRDAVVGYPLLVCRDWRGLREDLAETASLADVVTVSAVTDPLAALDEELLRPSFPDLVRVRAQHYIADLVTFWPSRDHRRAVRAAMHVLDIDVEDAPAGLLSRWAALTDEPLPGTSLGLEPGALNRQMSLPGCVAFSALAEDGPVAMALVYVGAENAYLHAMDSSEQGREMGARYALVQAMVEDMAGRGLRSLDLGAAQADPDFMDGWTEQLRPSYQCGRVVDRLAYDELAAVTGTTGSAIFPAYREPVARIKS